MPLAEGSAKPNEEGRWRRFWRRMRIRLIRRTFHWPALLGLRAVAFVVPLIAACVGRFRGKVFDIGLGPEPLINNVYHKRALEAYGYRVETFVNTTCFITEDFDLCTERDTFRWLPKRLPASIQRRLRNLCLCCLPFTRYRCLYIYFNGGPLGVLYPGGILSRLEPWLLRLARTKVIVMPYGGDVDEMTRASNLNYKHALATDYPKHHLRRALTERQIDRWTQDASHVISGCDWVDYMYHWDTLMLAHFSIDTEEWKPPASIVRNEKVRILHAPNHRTIKGSRFLIEAIEELVEEGLPIELIVLQGVSNDEIKDIMATVDIVADQLIVGWYAMFAIEGMAMGKPVLCYLRDDLVELYESAGIVRPGEIPLVNCSPSTVKDVIRDLVSDRDRLQTIGERSREYVARHHSLESVGSVFDRINRSIGIQPSAEASKSVVTSAGEG